MDVLELILDQARAQPHRPAVKDPTRDLSFAALEEEVAKLAGGLWRVGVRPEDRVALHLPNSVDFLVAALACMWIGALFVPLASSDPVSRLRSIVEDCDPCVVLTSESALAGQDAASYSYPGRPSASVATLAATGFEPPPRASEENRSAYCIYTSGTTGHPKGVLIRHEAFTCAVLAAVRLMGFSAETRALCVSPFHFDGSFGTLFPTPAAGGSLVIPNRESLLFPRVFCRTVFEEAITHTSFSPSYLRLLLSSRELSSLSATRLGTLGLGGEAVSVADLESLWSLVPGLRVFNRYGPMEATIAVTTFEVTPEVLSRGALVPVGQPHAGVVFRLVDADGNLVERPGEVGELYIGGTQLMAGYWRDPDLTAETVRTDVVPGERLFRTRDLMYRDDWGEYVYLDRTDRVVNRKAVRISLAEIANTLRSLPEVSAAVCLPFEQTGQVAIAAFVTCAAPMSALELRREALTHLPSTMLPDVFKIVDAIPMSSAGKVDERALLIGAGLAEMEGNVAAGTSK